MHLTSSAFLNGQTIPRRHTCDGDNISPELTWTEAPTATRSFALLCDDPDAPVGVWHHWAVYDIPAASTTLSEGVGRSASAKKFKQAVNDFHRSGYGGPCPPRGHGPHRYHFRLLALSVDRLDLTSTASCVDVERVARKHLLAEAILNGTYER